MRQKSWKNRLFYMKMLNSSSTRNYLGLEGEWLYLEFVTENE